jgi:hypothetical protein
VLQRDICVTQAPLVPSRPSQSSLWSFIFGVLGCIPFVCGILAVVLGLMGIFTAGKPGVHGRWMAVVGFILGMISIAGWSFGGMGALAAWNFGKAAVAVITAPGHATHDFIQALDKGDDAAAKTHASMSDEDLLKAKTLIQAQGGFIDSTFNNVQINEGGSGHVSGTAQFKGHMMHVQADLMDTPDGWKVASIEIVP